MFHDNLEKKSSKDDSIIASFEPVQKMKFYMPVEDGTSSTSLIELGPRTCGDGAECPEVAPADTPRSVRFDDSAKKYDGRGPYIEKWRSLQIAAKFSKVIYFIFIACLYSFQKFENFNFQYYLFWQSG